MSTAEAADDNEKTVTGEPVPGRQRADSRPGHTLPSGTRLRDYEITGLIGEGGFGIVYLAWDHSLQRKVAIKEYMPASMAARVNGSSAIVVKSERHLDTFRAGLKSFVNEARLLARFDHPSLVKVYRFWEENGTAYMVMPYYEGPTLKAALAGLGRAPSEAELRGWLKPLLDALTVMHAAQCYHRDIAPDNILLTSRGPLLLDFGAARRVIGDMTHAITVVLKPGYAPIEQYGDVASMAQGAWTDLYALGSVVYYAITGKTPTSSVERLMDDRLEPLSVSAAGRYSDAFLRAIDAALAVRPADRPQNGRQFRALLDAGLPPSSVPEAEADSGWASGYGTMPAALAPDLLTQALAPADEQTVVAAEPAALRDAPQREVPIGNASSPRLRKRAAIALLAGIAIVALAIFGWLQPRDAGPAAPRAPASAPALSAAPAPRAAEPAVVAPTPASPVVVPIEAPAAEQIPLPSEAKTAPTPEPAVAATVASPRTPRPRRETTAPPRSDTAALPTRPAPHAQAISSRCSDILQKASLEPLTASEAAYLKRECR